MQIFLKLFLFDTKRIVASNGVRRCGNGCGEGYVLAASNGVRRYEGFDGTETR